MCKAVARMVRGFKAGGGPMGGLYELLECKLSLLRKWTGLLASPGMHTREDLRSTECAAALSLPQRHCGAHALTRCHGVQVSPYLRTQ